MIDRLRKQEQIGKPTFQFTFHSTTTCKQRNNTSSKLKPTTLTFCRCKSFACPPARRTRFLLVHGAQSSPANCETKQSVNHPNIHHSPSQHNTTHAPFRGRARTQAPTTRNYTLELPTFGVIARVNPIQVQ